MFRGASYFNAAINGAFTETPTGTVDGANTVFTLTGIPNPPQSLQLYVRYGGTGAWLFLMYGIDYTLAGSTLTLTTAPDVASNLRASYWK